MLRLEMGASIQVKTAANAVRVYFSYRDKRVTNTSVRVNVINPFMPFVELNLLKTKLFVLRVMKKEKEENNPRLPRRPHHPICKGNVCACFSASFLSSKIVVSLQFLIYLSIT